MLELKDISVYCLDENFKLNLTSYRASDMIAKLVQNNITDFQKLKEYSESGNHHVDPRILEVLKKTEVDLARRNQRNLKLYSFPKNENIEIDRESKCNDCSYLVLDNPMNNYIKTRYLWLKKCSISFVKHLISHCDSSGKNLLTYIYKIGDASLPKVDFALRFYDEQIIRQLKENDSRDTANLFYLNRDKKMKIVLSNYYDIVEFFLDNADTCIWGKLTDKQKLLMLSSTLNQGIDDVYTKIQLVKIITDYTTLTELESGITKTKMLDRFIVK